MTHVLQKKKVVTSFIRHQGKILLLRRSATVGSYRGKWAGVSGYLEGYAPLEQALTEIEEETGLTASDIFLVSQGIPFEVVDRQIGTCWLIHPFLFETDVPEKVRLDWEHTEMRWVVPAMLHQLPTVPELAEAYERCGRDRGAEDSPGKKR